MDVRIPRQPTLIALIQGKFFERFFTSLAQHLHGICTASIDSAAM